jgi:hypothetical protein
MQPEAMLKRFGFWVDSGPGGALYAYIPAGVASDGAPLTSARPLSGGEADLYREGRYAELRGSVTGRVPAAPTPRVRSGWKRFLDGLRRIVGVRR